MKFIWKNRSTKIWFLVTSIVLVIAIIANGVLLFVPIAGNSLDLVFGGQRTKVVEDLRNEMYNREFVSKEAALQAAQDFVIDVEAEGITLLKNNGNSLPLTENQKVSVFGKNSVNLVYSGSGSASSLSTKMKTFYDSLSEAGIYYNETLKDFYEDNSKSGEGRPGNPAMTSGQRLSGFATGETPMSSYTDDVTASYADYNDAAIVVISRIGGEGFDLPRTMATDFTGQTATEGAVSAEAHYLELDANEKALLEHVKENFSNVIVVLNTGTTMEIDELKKDEGIDSILWMGFPGSTGVMAVGQILAAKTTEGEAISPSGQQILRKTQPGTIQEYMEANLEIVIYIMVRKQIMLLLIMKKVFMQDIVIMKHVDQKKNVQMKLLHGMKIMFHIRLVMVYLILPLSGM